MQQLSGSDNIFLLNERDNVYNHVAMLLVYDVSTAPGGRVRFKDILTHFEERIERYPLFRQRLVPAPMGIDRPYWVETDEVDVEFHIRHIALPDPGDWRQLMIQVARLHSRPLDRNWPMWEAYVIEGLDNVPKLPKGSFAMFVKLHHALVDGVAGIHLAQQFHTTSPEIPRRSGEGSPLVIDRAPSNVELLSRTVANSFTRAVKLGTVAKRTASLATRFAGEILGVADDGGVAGFAFPKPPDTRFDTNVSAHRVVQGFGMPISRIKRVRSKLPGVTLNDIFLAVAGGGVRKYLVEEQDLPEDSLVALMPMALKSSGTEGGNAVGAAMVAIRSDIDDPLDRLDAVRKEAINSKLTAEKLGTDLFDVLMDAVPGTIGNLILEKVLINSFNLTVSNVRGPDFPLYLAGAKAMCLYPVSIPTRGAGLNITGVSYNGVMWVSVVSCRKLLPDPGRFLDCMRSAWEELLAAADALPGPESAKPVKAVKKRTRKKSKARKKQNS